MELKKANFMIDSNNPQDILKNGYVMLIDPETNKMIKSAVEMSFLSDLSDTNKKLKVVFKDKTVILNISSIN